MNTDIEIRANIGKEIKEILDQKKVTITELSKRVGEKIPATSRALNGKYLSSSEKIKEYLLGLEYTEEEATELMKKWFIEKLNK